MVGPYLGNGLRTEHLMVYGSLLFLLFKGEVRLRGPAVFLVFAQMVLFMGVAVSTLTAPNEVRSSTGYSVVRSPLAGADDLLLVLAAVLVGLSLGRTKTGTELAQAAIYRGIVLVAALNLALQVLQVFGQGQMIFEFFNRGLAGAQVVRYSQEVGGAAFSWDRFPGMFVQPFEGGVFYGVALLMWVFRWGLHRPQIHAVSGCIIVSGAALAGSKAALPALLLVLVAAVLRWPALPKIDWVRRLASFVPVSLGLVLLMRWLGVDPLERLRLDQESPISSLSGGRFGTGLAASWTEEILQKSPFGGFGFSGYPLPADTMLLGWLSIGGLFAVSVWVAILAVTAYAASSWRRETHNVGLVLVVFSCLAGFGGPALSANRSSTLLWVLIATSCLGAWRWHTGHEVKVHQAVSSPSTERLSESQSAE